MDRLGWLPVFVVAVGLCSVGANPVEAAARVSRTPVRKKRTQSTFRPASRAPHLPQRPSRSGSGAKAKTAPQATKSPEKLALEIADLKSAANAATVTAALCRLPGVQSAVVDARIGLAVVDFDPMRTGLPQFLTACREAGFEAEEYRVENRFPKPIKLKGG